MRKDTVCTGQKQFKWKFSLKKHGGHNKVVLHFQMLKGKKQKTKPKKTPPIQNSVPSEVFFKNTMKKSPNNEKWKTNKTMADLSPSLLIITLFVNGLNKPTN